MNARRRLRRHPSEIQLEAWFDGEADDEVAWHVLGCDRCFRHLGGTARLHAGLRAVLRDPSTLTPSDAHGVQGPLSADHPAEWIRTTARVGAVRTTAPATVRTPRVKTPLMPAAVATMVLMVGVGTAVAGPLRAAVMSGGTRASSTSPSHTTEASAIHSSIGSNRTTASGGAAGQGSGSGHGTAARDPATHQAAAHGADGPGSAAPGGGSLANPATGATGPVAAAAPGSPLELAVVTPDAGPGAAEGAEVRDAAAAAVAEANATGGVGGAPVTLDDVSAQDTAGLAALRGHVGALVGGFGAAAPAGVPWLLPADPAVTGADVVGAEPSDAAAGTQLASALLAQGVSGTVGVVNDGGPDSSLSTGIAQVMTVDTAPVAPPSSCLSAAGDLQRAGVVALAVAGSPELAASCLAALQTLSWQPPAGVLVAPSAVYAGLGTSPLAAVSNVQSVLGFPWPTADQSGAQRFRSSVPGASSYRALVTFAAVELAVDVARAGSTVDPASLGRGTWRNDLFDYTGLMNAGAHVVDASGGGWVPAS
ncbi:MAG TPA: hypothetical protein VKU86_10445 [Acidimicrobiales bacterium]|nr:hypothetical protein [Acidimicrobiales bacterium]